MTSRRLAPAAAAAALLLGLGTAVALPSSAAQPATAAPRAAVGGPSVKLTPLRAEQTGAQCDARAEISGIAPTGVARKYASVQPAGTGGFSLLADTPSMGAIREWTYLDDTRLVFAVFADGHAETLRWNPPSKTYPRVAHFPGPAWKDVKHLVPQGRGMVYAVLMSGAMRGYAFNQAGNGFSQTFTLPAASPGWGSYTAVTGGGNGVVYAYDKAKGVVWAQRKTLPYQAGGAWRPRVAIATGITDGVDIASSGDGVVWLTRADGSVVRIIQSNPMAESGAVGAPVRVARDAGYPRLRSLVADLGGCGDDSGALRLRISQLALSWRDTNRQFCASHTCTKYWWCTEFAWAAWREAGVTDLARFMVYPYDATKSKTATSNVVAYANSYGTNLQAVWGASAALQHVRVGDLVVWEAGWSNGQRWAGHNAVVVGVIKDSAGRVTALALMLGNYTDKVYFEPRTKPGTTLFVSPRL